MPKMNSPRTTSQPLLTLAIPTFNRSTYLSELLESLFEQLMTSPEVQLLISDNCSSDDTAAVLESFRSRGLRFRYLRNETNIGVDANFLQCFDEAGGKYFWLLGDDDILVPDAVKQIVSLLQTGETRHGEQCIDFDLVYLSSFGFTGKYQPASDNGSKDPFGRFAEVVTDGNYFLRRVNALVSLISAVIVNKNRLITEGHLPIERLDGSSLSQLAWIFPVLHRKARILYVWERLVGYRRFNSGGWAPCQVFGVNLQSIASTYFVKEPILARSLMNGVLSHWFPSVMGDMRRGEHSALISEDCTALLTRLFRHNWRYWAFTYPVIASPLWLTRIIHPGIVLLHKFTRACQVLFRHKLRKTQYLERC